MSKFFKILTCGIGRSKSDEHLEIKDLPKKVSVGSLTKTPNDHETDVPKEVSEIELKVDLSSTVPVQDPKPSHGDLWDEAYKKLQTDQPKLFTKYKQCILDEDGDGGQIKSVDLDQLEGDRREKYLATQIEGKVQMIHEEEWSGAAKVYQTTVQAVLFAKGFIAQAASNEPHAALAWTGVSMLLPLLLKPDEQHRAATEAVADVSNLMLRYRVIEINFRTRVERLQNGQIQGDATIDLIEGAQTKIVDFYCQILEFQIRMASYYSRHSFNRYLRDLATLDDWKEMRTAIDESDKAINADLKVIGNVHLDNSLEAQSSELRRFTEEGIPILESLHSGLSKFIASEAQRKLLDHLAPDTGAVDYKEGFEPGYWHPSSGEWVKQSKEYQAWWKSKGGLLWCYGVAGAGKTVIATILGDDLFARSAGDSTVQVIRIFFDYHHTRTREQCLASMWKQLASRRPLDEDELARLNKTYVEKRTRPDETTWKDMLHSETSRYSHIFVIADALDESKVQNPLQFIEELINLLPSANFLITTRPDLKVESVHTDAATVWTMEIKANSNDLLQFVKKRISRSENLKQVIERKPELNKMIEEQVVLNSQGLFLLAELLMYDLEDSSKPSEVQRKLKDPPANLDKAYDTSLSRIESQSGAAPRYGKETLYTLCVAKAPITFDQLRCLLSLEENSESLEPDDFVIDRAVKNSCAGLVVFDKETNFVRFGHKTTQDYLYNFHTNDIEKGHIVLLKKCLAYLRLPTMRLEYWSHNDQIRQRLLVHPLLGYAAVYWGDHAREVGTNFVEVEILDLLQKRENLACAIRVLLFKTALNMINSHKWGEWGAEQRAEGKMRPINIVAYYGLDSILTRLIQELPEQYLGSGDPFGNVLHWAARGNHEAVLNRLMELPRIKEIINQYSELAHTPLHVALVFSKTRALEMLLKNGADPTLKIQRDPDWHSLGLAIKHGPLKHVEILLKTEKNDALLWTTDILKRLAFHIATEYDDTESLRLLLPLYGEAVKKNHRVQEMTDAMRRNPLHQAAQSGRYRVTQAILKHSLGREFARGFNYRQHTPFQTAAFAGKLEVVKSYYDYDREWLISQHDALHLAAQRGRSKVLHELLDVFGDHQNAQQLFQDALVYAVYNGKVECVEELTNRITLADDTYRTSMLLMAAETGHVEVVQHLFKLGAPINARNQDGFTALHLAVKKRMSSVVRVLLEAEGLEIKDQDRRTLVQNALQNRDVPSSKLLLQYGLPIPEVDDECQRWLDTQKWWSYYLNLRQGKDPYDPEINSGFSPSSTNDVFQAAVYLNRQLRSKVENLPLVNWILELAEYWTVVTSQRDGEEYYDENDPLPVYLRSIPIIGRIVKPVRWITFHVSSHDQTFYNANAGSSPGTFDGYTWFSVSREAADGQRSNSTQLRMLKNKTNRTPNEWTDFNLSWPYQQGFDRTCDEPAEGAKEKWLANLRGNGDRLLLLPIAEFQNWRNHVRRAEVRIYSTCLRKAVYRSLAAAKRKSSSTGKQGPVIAFATV